MSTTTKFAYNAIMPLSQIAKPKMSNRIYYCVEDFKESRSEDVIQIIRSIKSLRECEIRVENHYEYGLSIILVGLGWQARGTKTLWNRLGSLNNRWERWDRKHGQSHLRACTGDEVGNVRIDLAWM